MDALDHRSLLRHRLNAACNESERLQVLTTALSMSITSIHEELMLRGWSDKDSAFAITDALQYIEAGLLDTLVE